MGPMTMCGLVGMMVSMGVLVQREEIVLEAEQPSAGKWRWGDFVPRARPLDTASGGQIIVLGRGDWLEYRLTVPEAGNYEVVLATGGNDTRQAGRLFIDGGPEIPVEDARDRLDLDTPATAEDRHQRELILFTQPLGVVHLAAGEHTLRVEHAGREGFSSAFGVDFIKLRPTQAEATLQAGDRREGTTDFRQAWQFDGGPPPLWWREEELFGHTEGRWDPALADSPIRVFFGGYPADDPASYAAANAAGKHILHYVSFMTHCHLPRAQTASKRDPQFLEYWSLVDHPEWRLVNEQGLTVNVFMPEYQASTIRELCLNAPGAMEACLNLARSFMEAGAGGIFVDNVHPSTHCHGPEFGRHEHVYPDQNNQECLHRLLSRLRRLVKSYGEDKLVMLNSGGPNAYYADVGDALMWESYAYTYTEGGQRVLNPAAIRAAADYWRHYVDEEGGVIAALSYIQADAQHSERENAFYAYVGAKLSHFHWMGDGAPELHLVRLGRPLAYIEDVGPLWVRRYENGLVVMNPTGEAVEQTLPWPRTESPWDLFAGEPIAPQEGQFSVRIPPESGRVYVLAGEQLKGRGS